MIHRTSIKTSALCLVLTAMLFGPILVDALHFVEVHRDGVGGEDGLNGPRCVTVSPDGRHVYVAGYLDNAIAMFSREGRRGTLQFWEIQKDGVKEVDGLSRPASIVLSPDGRYVYAAGYLDNAVAAFRRNETTGKLGFIEIQKDGVGSVDGLSGIWSVALSPDGRNLYTASYWDNSVGVFDRNSKNGALRFLEFHKDGVDGVDGLDGLYAVTVSPDGKNVYASSWRDAAVTVFSRNKNTGRLNFIEVHKYGVHGLEGLNAAVSVTVSPEGKHVYVAGYRDNSVTVFKRNSDTGSLSFVEVHKDGFGGVDGLYRAVHVVMDSEGKQLYVAGFWDSAIAVFNRDEVTGKLRFVRVYKNGIEGITGIEGPWHVNLSPDGKHLYVAGFLEDAVAVFEVSK